MLILTIRTDKPEAEMGLYQDHTQLVYETWYAHRELSVTIHQKIKAILDTQGKELHDLQGIVTFAGPGSFTGLRIGLTVANALAYSLKVPIVGVSGEEQWLEKGLARLLGGGGGPIALPEYGAPVHITTPKK